MGTCRINEKNRRLFPENSACAWIASAADHISTCWKWPRLTATGCRKQR